jgi:uncharacterized protein YdaU (DUF1376 family)
MTKVEKYPWFPLWVGDFLSGTVHLSDAEVGCYVRLLCHQWLKGSIPDEVERLQGITQSTPETIGMVVGEFFPGGVNPRLESERVITADKRQAAHDRGVKGAAARWGQTPENPHSSGRGHSSKDVTEQHRASESPGTDDGASNAQALEQALPGPLLEQYSSQPQSPSESSPESESQSPAQSKSPPSAKPRVTNQMWDAFKASYPKREGTQNWGEARQRANGLVKAHTDWSEIMLGVRRYADHISDAGKSNTQHVLQAATFLSPKRMQWTESYAPASTQNDLTRQNVANIQKFLGDNP